MIDQPDIAVVGGGPAGLMAATTAAQAGGGVTVLEQRSWAGGRLGLQVQPLQGPRSMYGDTNGVDLCRRLVDEATSAGAEITLGTAVSRLGALDSESFVWILRHTGAATGTSEVRARGVVLATGGTEPRWDFPGSSLRGIMLSGDAQIMLNVEGIPPGRRALMVGSDNAGLLIAANLLEAGIKVVAVVDESPVVLGREFNAAPLRDAGVAILTSTSVFEALGRSRVEAATVLQMDPGGRPVPGTHRTYEVDVVCLAGPRKPDSKLASIGGCQLMDMDTMGGPVPVHNRRMATPLPGLYICGDAAGVENGAVSLESGRMAGLSAAEDLGFSHPRAESYAKLARGRLAYLRRGRRGLSRRQAKAALASEYRRLTRSG